MRCRNTKLVCMSSLVLWGAFMLAGCAPDAEFRINAVQLRAQEKIELETGKHYDEVHLRDIGNLLTAMYGTPDDPHFPQISEDYDNLISLENLKMAAGPVSSDREGTPVGLFREHCANCHGITGDGAGPSAALLNPYPRDFRLGKFKFKQTKVNKPPRDEDLRRIIRNGIPGTSMASFRTLSDAEVDALVDYVKYLAIRGQTERGLIKLLADLDDGQRLIDFDYPGKPKTTSADPKSASANSNRSTPTSSGPQENQESDDAPKMDEKREEQLDNVVNEVLFDLFDSWLEPKSINIPVAPAAFDPKHADHQKLIEQGRKLFFGKANCLQCHGNTGLGDGGQINYDDWTTSWTKDTGVNLQDKSTFQEFLDLGALPPRQLRPRNLRLGVFRGGNFPTDIFHRVSEGIEGTPMPATLTLTPEEKWALVAYVMNMPYEDHNDNNKQKSP